jgi:hypothetical protein
MRNGRGKMVKPPTGKAKTLVTSGFELGGPGNRNGH